MSLSVLQDTSFFFVVADEVIPYIIVRRSRLLRMRIQVSLRYGFVVSIPEKMSEQMAHAFFSSQSVWVLRQWKRLCFQRQRFRHLLGPSLQKNSVMYLGKLYQLVIEVVLDGRSAVVVEDGVIRVYCHTAELAESILLRWYRQQARAVIAGALALYERRMHVASVSFSIKDQRTRWGSCSSSGIVNFSWRLILAPKFVLDYVVVHELAHLREMNHSRRFWNLVALFYPDYEKAEKWLKEHSLVLQAF